MRVIGIAKSIGVFANVAILRGKRARFPEKFSGEHGAEGRAPVAQPTLESAPRHLQSSGDAFHGRLTAQELDPDCRTCGTSTSEEFGIASRPFAASGAL